MQTRRITGSGDEFRIGKIVCVGRNYAEHARELGNETPAEPVLFMKPATSLIENGGIVRIPEYSSCCHHEIELALLVGEKGKNIRAGDALRHLAGYGTAIDMTLRDIQDRLKLKGLPWDIAKGFDTSCPLSDFIPVATLDDPQNLTMTLSVNGVERQRGVTSDMIHPVSALVAHISRFFTLEPGDVILTGTPSGVGEVKSGDVITAEISSVGRLEISVM